jgi:competence protein ComGC
VGAALGAMIGLIGKEAVLKIRGKNGGVVKRLYGYDDVMVGAVIGDIKQNNIKNILAQVEYTPDGKKDSEEVLSYELQFVHRKGDQAVKIAGTLSVNLTEDDKNLEKKNNETVVALTIQQSADYDLQMEKLLEQDKTDEAIKVKEEEITMLKKALPLDTTGRIASVLQKAEKSLNDLKTQGNSKHMQKQVKYHRQLKRMDSADWLAL